MALAHSSGPGWEAIRSGSAITSDGLTMRAPSTPAGVRWNGVSSAPESVVGMAATGAPVTPPIALAVSITRPPPSATRGRLPASGSSEADSSSTKPAGTWISAAGSSGALPAARSVVSRM